MIGMGSKVMLNDKGRHKVSKEDEGKVFEVRSNPFEICGTKCVLLKGKRGDYAIDALIEVEKEKEEAGKWIPCSERLPDKNGEYLVTYRDDIVENYVIVRNFYNGKFEPMPWSEKHIGRKVLAWQPLPEPYQPKGEGEK